jgi:hypothetical protein
VPIRQRSTPDPEHLRPVGAWAPDRLRPLRTPSGPATPAAGVVPSPGDVPDHYVVVDELDELGCRLAVDPWPAVDGEGRLVFDDDTVLVSVPPRTIHEALTAARSAQGDPAPDRPLRIGDVIAVWWGPLARELGFPQPAGRFDGARFAGSRVDGPPPEPAPEPAIEMVDITADARLATNTAAQAAAADVLHVEDLRELGLAPSDLDEGEGTR